MHLLVCVSVFAVYKLWTILQGTESRAICLACYMFAMSYQCQSTIKRVKTVKCQLRMFKLIT